MIQLALETTGTNGSLAVLEGESVILDRRFGDLRRTTVEFAIELDAALRWCGDRSHKLEALSVAVGPGSFTGLRIAVTTAKTLGYALALPIVPVGSLAAIAAVSLLESGSENVLVGLNAYRKQVFVAEFSRDELLRDNLLHPCNHRAAVVGRGDWDSKVAQLFDRTDWTVTGDRSIFSDSEVERLAVREHSDAVGVGFIASKMISASPEQSPNCFIDPFALSARYLKQSAAEEKATSH